MQVLHFMELARDLRSRWGVLRAAVAGSELTIGGAAAPRTSADLKAYVASGRSRAETLMRRHIDQHGQVRRVLEICRSGCSHRDWFPDAVVHDSCVGAADREPVDLIAALREIPDASFDVVYSVDVIEHLKAPWRVADEIARVLKPGGFTFHTTLFTTCYQPQPEDFFRFTPDGLKSLFGGLECLTAEFDATERRQGGGRRGKACPDIFGGSREGWRVHFAGRKAGGLR